MTLTLLQSIAFLAFLFTAVTLLSLYIHARADRERLDLREEARAAVDFAFACPDAHQFLTLWAAGARRRLERTYPEWADFRRNYLLGAE